MIFIAPRSLQAQDRLRFFHSIRLWRDERTGELVVMWRRNRFLGLVLGILGFLYLSFVVVLVSVLHTVAPDLPITFAGELNPVHWLSLPHQWHVYQMGPNQEPALNPANAPLSPPGNVTSPDVDKTPGTPSPLEKPITVEPVVAAVVYSPLLTAFFAHNGTALKLRTILSINIQGTVTLPGGNPLNFTLVKKMPDKVRLNIHDQLSTGENTIVSDGNTSWKWVGDPFQNGIRQTTPEEISAVLRERLYCDIPVEVIEHLSDVTEPETPNEDDHRFFLQMPYGMRVQITPDHDTWRPSHLQVVYPQDGSDHTYLIEVHDWMMVEGVPEPASLSVTLDGKPLLECRIHSITYNSGMYDILFQPPADAPSSSSTATSSTSLSASPPPADSAASGTK